MRPSPDSGWFPHTLVSSSRLALLAALIAPGASTTGAAQTGGYALGDATVRFESQDTSGWSVLPKAGKTRDAVVLCFNTVYTPGSSVPLLWTGSIAGCNPGTTNVDHQQAVIDRVNYYRALVDLPAVTLLTGTPTTQDRGRH